MRVGRPSKLTADRKRRFLELLRAGAFPEVAAAAASIAPSTYYAWMAKGREDREEAAAEADAANDLLTLGLEVEPVASEYQEFLEAVEQAVASAEALLVGTLMRQATGGGPSASHAADTLLKKRFRERWGDRVHVDQTVSGQIAHGHLVVEATPTDWLDAPFAERVVRILQAAGKMPVEVPVDDIATALIAAPLQVPAGIDAGDGRALAPD